MNKNLARLIACFLADPYLAASKAHKLYELASSANRLLCDARRIRDGSFPPEGPNVPNEYYRQMALSVYPSGCVVSQDEYQRARHVVIERAKAAVTPASTAKRGADPRPATDAEPPAKRPVVAAVRPATPRPSAPASETQTRPQQTTVDKPAGAPVNSTDHRAKILLNLNGSRCVSALPEPSLLVTNPTNP